MNPRSQGIAVENKPHHLMICADSYRLARNAHGARSCVQPLPPLKPFGEGGQLVTPHRVHAEGRLVNVSLRSAGSEFRLRPLPPTVATESARGRPTLRRGLPSCLPSCASAVRVGIRTHSELAVVPEDGRGPNNLPMPTTNSRVDERSPSCSLLGTQGDTAFGQRDVELKQTSQTKAKAWLHEHPPIRWLAKSWLP